MKEKILAHFNRWNPRYFVVVTVLILIITDLLNGLYLKLFWSHRGMSELLVRQSIAQSGLVLEDFGPDTVSEMLGFVDNTFYFFLFLVLVNNLFFYVFYLLKRLWAQGYVLFYTFSASILALTFIFDNGGLPFGWTIYNIASIPLYLYLFLGVKMLKMKTTTIPASEKKAQ